MKGKELLFIAISSFVLTIIWIASNVYHSYATSTIDTLLKLQILPISPTFDIVTIGKIKDRQAIQPATTSFIPATPTPTLSSSPALETTEVVPTLPEEEVVIPSVAPIPSEGIIVTPIISITPAPIESGPTP